MTNPEHKNQAHLREDAATGSDSPPQSNTGDQTPTRETLIDVLESTLRGQLAMARARYELALERVELALAEGRSIDDPEPRWSRRMMRRP